MRRVISIGLVTGLLLIAAPALAQDAGCGQGFNLATVAETIEAVDDRIYSAEEWLLVMEAIEAEDRNGDGYLCWKQYEPNRGQDKFWGAEDYVVTNILDNNAEGRQ